MVRELDKKALMDERLTRISISIYGYLKRIAAIDCLQNGQEKAYLDEPSIGCKPWSVIFTTR